jgi:hypothetical protein
LSVSTICNSFLGVSCSQELELLAGNAARLMMCWNFEKPGVPVPRTKLTEVILAEFKQEPTAQQRRITTVGKFKGKLCNN